MHLGYAIPSTYATILDLATNWNYCATIENTALRNVKFLSLAILFRQRKFPTLQPASFVFLVRFWSRLQAWNAPCEIERKG